VALEAPARRAHRETAKPSQGGHHHIITSYDTSQQ
jgi:hypothetical protein